MAKPDIPVPSEDWAPCPRCGSAKVERTSPASLGLALFASGGCLMWIPIIGWVLAPVLIVLALVVWITGALPGGKVTFRCGECRKVYHLAPE